MRLINASVFSPPFKPTPNEPIIGILTAVLCPFVRAAASSAMNPALIPLLSLVGLGLINHSCAFSSSSLWPSLAAAPICNTNHVAPPFRIRQTSLSLSTAVPTTANSGVTKGDTKGANLLLTDIFISTGDGNQILKNINFRVDPKERWGIVGPNGCGKSTLLGAITGSVRIDEGTALVASKVKVGYLKQTAVSGSTKTVREEAASEMEAINKAKSQMERLEKLIAGGDASEKTLNDLADAQSRFEDVGGWTQDQDVDLVLKGLGFQPSDSDRFCSDFSGGWQMRIALARLLLSQPDLLLLDEPSNHLDSSARDWLANYLANYQGSILLVSHDVALLTKSVNSIAEVSGQTLIQYVSCNYDKYLTEKEFRAKSAMAEYERNVKEAARLQEFVDKYGASATKASSAQSRVKMIERMRKEGKLDPPPVAVTERVFKPSLVLPDPPKGIGETLLALEEADIGYGEGGKPILEGIDLVINRGMKLILRGPNGAGVYCVHYLLYFHRISFLLTH
jgi:ATP-binding cassette subfamily F protein 3